MNHFKKILLTALLLPLAGLVYAQETEKPTDSGIPEVKLEANFVEGAGIAPEVPLPDNREHVYKIPPEIEAIKRKAGEEVPRQEGVRIEPQKTEIEH